MGGSRCGEVRVVGELCSIGGVFEQELSGGLVETLGPVEAGVGAPRVHAGEVVDDVAAAEYQDAGVAQRCQLRA